MNKVDDAEYLTVMSELKFISQVGEDEFINTKTGMIEQKNIIRRAIRGLFHPQETGKSASKYCKLAIVRGLNLLSKYEKIEDAEEYVKTIKQYILEACEGIERLKHTHSDNTFSVTVFDSIITCVNQRLKTNSL